MRATRAYIAGFGTAGSLLAGAAILFVFASAVVSFRGWPQMTDAHQAVAVVPAQAPTGSPVLTRFDATVSAQARRFRAPAASSPSGLTTGGAKHPATTVPAATGHHLTVPSIPTQTVTTPAPDPVTSTPTEPTVTTTTTDRPTVACSKGPGCGVRKVSAAVGGATTSLTGSLGKTTGSLGKSLGSTVSSATGSLGSKLTSEGVGLGSSVVGVGIGLAKTLTAATGTTGLDGIVTKAGQTLGNTITTAGTVVGGVVQPGSQNASLGTTGTT